MGDTVWSELRDVAGRSAEFIPGLLDEMKIGQPEARRQAAETEFWESINALQMLCPATAPGIDAYLELVEAGQIPLTPGLAFVLADLLADVTLVEKKESRKSIALKAEVRAAMQRRTNFFTLVFETHIDVNVRAEISELLARLGDAKPKQDIVAPLVRELLDHKNDPQRWSLLEDLDSRSGEIEDWEKHLNVILLDGTALLRFHAACSLMKFSQGSPPAGLVAALKELPSHTDQPLFKTCTEAFCKAGVSLAMSILLEIMESVLVRMADTLEANRICRDLLIAVFQPQATHTGGSVDPGVDEIEILWTPKKPYPFARKLSTADRRRLCTILAGCETLWVDHNRHSYCNPVRTVRTNLWSLFRLPGDRESMREFGALTRLGDLP